jgi:hypothetical protein
VEHPTRWEVIERIREHVERAFRQATRGRVRRGLDDAEVNEFLRRAQQMAGMLTAFR